MLDPSDNHYIVKGWNIMTRTKAIIYFNFYILHLRNESSISHYICQIFFSWFKQCFDHAVSREEKRNISTCFCWSYHSLCLFTIAFDFEKEHGPGLLLISIFIKIFKHQYQQIQKNTSSQIMPLFKACHQWKDYFLAFQIKDIFLPID